MNGIKNLCRTLSHIFDAVVAVLPFSLALILSVNYLFLCGRSEEYVEHYILLMLGHRFLALAALLFVLALLIFLMCRWGTGVAVSSQVKLMDCLMLFLIALGVRLCLYFPLREQLIPFSDFARVWSIAQTPTQDDLAYYTLFPTYLNYAAVEKLLIRVFGADYFVVIALACIANSVSCALVYGVADSLGASREVAIFSSALYLLMPSGIFLCATGAPDLLVVMFDLAGLLCVLKGWANEGLRRIALFAMAGICLGMGSALKSFGVIIILAFVVGIFFSLGSDETAGGLKGAITLVISILVMCVGYSTVRTLALNASNAFFSTSAEYGNSTTHFLLVGLNTQGEGQISVGSLSRAYYQRFLSNGYDVAEAKTYALGLLRRDWDSGGVMAILNLFKQKLVWAWQDDVTPAGYFIEYESSGVTAGLASLITSWLTAFGPSLSQCFYMLLVFFCTIWCAASRKLGESRGVRFIKVIVFGYFCLMLLSEAQSRYKCLVLPLFCIGAALGVNALQKWIIRIIRNEARPAYSSSNSLRLSEPRHLRS